ncbi:BioC, biotin biosynthesis protein BioC [Burkholderiaceae bacterium]
MPELVTDSPPTLDPIASARWAQWPHAQSPWLNEEVGRRMADRLQWIRLEPQRWVDWAPLSGGLQTHRTVQARYPKALCDVVESTAALAARAKKELQAPWWQRLARSDVVSMDQPESGAAEMVWANMALHTAADPQALLRQWHDLLAVDGFLMFSCLGPDTLRELHAAYDKAGWPPASHAFTDMHDWGDMLVQAGFAEPVMDMERITLTYDSPASLIAECRVLGRNLHRGRFANLRGRTWRAQLEQILSTLAQPSQDGRLVVTVEVIYGHALKPLPRAKMSSESTVTLQAMRSLLNQSKRG